MISNKQDSRNPDCRGRYVAQEVNKGGEADAAFYAATPPLESKRMLFSMWAKEKTRNGVPLKLHFLDVTKAYFNGVPKRSMCIRLPVELGLGKNVVGRLRRCIYGTRDAGPYGNPRLPRSSKGWDSAKAKLHRAHSTTSSGEYP